MTKTDSIPAGLSRQDELYQEAAASYGAALDRLAKAYEADGERRRDLLQEIHIALWRSFAGFDGRCSVRTWVYRVAHNAATSHVIRDRRANTRNLVGLDALDAMPGENDAERDAGHRQAQERLFALIQQLHALDRQVVLLYLEGMEAATIGEITGISAGNVATKIHRIKNILARRFREGGHHGE